MLLSRASASAAAIVVAAVSGCSCGDPAASPVAAEGKAGMGGASGGGRGGTGARSGSATAMAGSGGAAGSPGACKMVKRPDHVPASFAPVNALGCECTFWLGKDPAALPALAWAPCGDNVLPGLGCEKVAVSGFGQDWFHFAAIASDTDHAGAPLAALAVFRDFVGPKTIVNWFWLDMTNLTAVAALVSDRAAGTCIAQIPRLAPGVLLLNVNQSKEVPREEGGASFAGNSGFATLRLGADGAAVYAASEPFGGTSNYTPTSTDVYGRLLDNTSAGIYRANGFTPKGELLDLAPFTSAFPEGSLGGSLVVLVSDGSYSGTGLYALTTGFRPLLPPSLAEERAAFDLGGDGSVLVRVRRARLQEVRRAHEASRLGLEPRFDLFPMTRHFGALVRRRHQRPRLHALRDLGDLLVGGGAVARKWQRFDHLDVAADGLPIESRCARDRSRTLPVRPATNYFPHINHGQHPVGHELLSAATRVAADRDSCTSRSPHLWLAP